MSQKAMMSMNKNVNQDPAQAAMQKSINTFMPLMLGFTFFIIPIPAAFANSTAYIVFRHFDCSDMFYLNLDDVVVTEGNPRPAASPVAPAPASYQAPKQGLSFVPGTHRQEASSTQALNSRDVVKINAKRK